VSLTVTDNDDASSALVSETVTVVAPPPPPPPPGGLTLTAIGSKVKGRHVVDLSWTGGVAPFTLTRDGVTTLIAGTSDTSYHDETGNRGGVTYVYEVCDSAPEQACSSAPVVF